MTKLQRNDVMDDELPLKFSALKKAEIAYFHKHRQESVFGNKDELIKRCAGCDKLGIVHSIGAERKANNS